MFVPFTVPTEYSLSVDKDGDVFHNAVLWNGLHDTNWEFVTSWIRPGDVFFDVGANIGTISIPVACQGASVHAFELLGANVAHLLRSIAHNELSDITVVLGAVSNRHYLAGIGGFSAWGTVVENAQLRIPTVVLDDYAAERGLSRLDLMKIDVEGSELDALRGAEGIIAKYRPDIVIECNAVTSGNAAYSYRLLLDFLVDRGYVIYRLHAGRLCPWDNSTVQEVIYTDYFATTKAAADIANRCGWSVAPMTLAESVASIIEQDGMPPIHKQYLLAIEHLLPTDLAADPAVAAIIESWRPQTDPVAEKVLLVGADVTAARG